MLTRVTRNDSSSQQFTAQACYVGPFEVMTAVYRHYPQIKLRGCPLKTPPHNGIYKTVNLASRFDKSLALFIEGELILQVIGANASKSVTFSLLGEWKSPSWQLLGSQRVSTLFKRGH